MSDVTLAEFLEGISDEACAREAGGPSQLLVPEPLRGEVAELLASRPIQVEGSHTLSDPDLLVGFTPDTIMTAFWAPGMNEAELETYQALRGDGMRPAEAQEAAKALTDLDETPAP